MECILIEHIKPGFPVMGGVFDFASWTHTSEWLIALQTVKMQL